MDAYPKWYIVRVCDIEDLALIATSDVLSVDFGIVNIATDSDTKSYNGKAIEKPAPSRPLAPILRRRGGSMAMAAQCSPVDCGCSRPTANTMRS
jgi:hypothetical protein